MIRKKKWERSKRTTRSSRRAALREALKQLKKRQLTTAATLLKFVQAPVPARACPGHKYGWKQLKTRKAPSVQLDCRRRGRGYMR